VSCLSKVANFNLPPTFGAFIGVTPFELCRDLQYQKTGVPGHRLHNPTFRRLSGTLTCARQTDTSTAYTLLAWHRMAKTESCS